jgi:hypothetical protein
MSQEFVTISPVLSSFINNSTILSAILFVAFCLYIRSKSKSGFSILNRLWRFVTGINGTNDRLIDQIMEIEEFNYHYNKIATSKKQTKKFEEWIIKYQLDFKLISKIGTNFNIDNLKVSKIKKHKLITPALFLAGIYMLSLISLSFATKPAALMKIDNGDWFWLNKNEAVRYDFFLNREKPWVINSETCHKSPVIPNRVNIEVTNSICESFNNKKSLKNIDKTIKEQRWFFGPIVTFLVMVMIFLFIKFHSLIITYDARKMILSKIKKYRREKIVL